MRYIGGKNRIADELVKIILETNPRTVVEPFCGALNITVELIKQNPRLKVLASDSHADLIEMWTAIREGWEPPLNLSKDEYLTLRNSDSSPLRTFAGYGCSFGGKWFGGYAQDKSSRNYCRNAYNSVMKKVPFLKNVEFARGDYSEQMIPDMSVVYCDPPYMSSTKPGERSAFDHDAFWLWVENLPNRCYVSECIAPSQMQMVWKKKVKIDMQTSISSNTRTECLFLNK